MVFRGYKFKFKFNASHYISLDDKETEHSHTFHIYFFIENKKELFIPYDEVERYIDNLLSNFKGKCLNNVDMFKDTIPTLENICYAIYQEIDNYCLSLGLNLVKIEISDNSISWYSLSELFLIDSTNNTYF